MRVWLLDSGSIAIEMTVSGNLIDSSRIGARVSQIVSPVIELLWNGP